MKLRIQQQRQTIFPFHPTMLFPYYKDNSPQNWRSLNLSGLRSVNSWALQKHNDVLFSYFTDALILFVTRFTEQSAAQKQMQSPTFCSH
jgi:hypothetical protein